MVEPVSGKGDSRWVLKPASGVWELGRGTGIPGHAWCIDENLGPLEVVSAAGWHDDIGASGTCLQAELKGMVA